MGRIAIFREYSKSNPNRLATEMIEERGSCLQLRLQAIRDIHAKRRVAARKNERLAFELCTITEGYYRASDVRVDEVALAQLPQNGNFLTLFQWSSVVDSHENDKR